MPVWVLAMGLLFVVMSLPAMTQSGEEFAPACRLPFQPIAVKHPIDLTCGAEGRTRSATTQAQNRAKNNLCAKGSPAAISLEDLRNLQAAVMEAKIPFGRPNRLPPDRSRLESLIQTTAGQAIGEGSLVRFIGFVLEAHVSDRTMGESVNCYLPGDESNDIHFTLAEAPGAGLCQGFVAEMIPHFRPSAWTAGNLNQLGRRPVRVDGQLLFDASHLPCKDGARVAPHPARAALWEIHPVYSLDVCSAADLGRCRESDSALWKPLEAWDSR
jgi:hypothetical protein